MEEGFQIPIDFTLRKVRLMIFSKGHFLFPLPPRILYSEFGHFYVKTISSLGEKVVKCVGKIWISCVKKWYRAREHTHFFNLFLKTKLNGWKVPALSSCSPNFFRGGASPWFSREGIPPSILQGTSPSPPIIRLCP